MTLLQKNKQRKMYERKWINKIKKKETANVTSKQTY